MKVFSSLFLALALTSPAHADEAKAETCLRTKVWDGYADGWAIRTMTSTTLEAGKTKSYLVTLYPGKEYFIQTCGAPGIAELDVLLYDTEGKVVQRGTSAGREPTLTLSSDKMASYYVVLHARAMAADTKSAGVALAVTYR
ncbi:MAG: hypothetical protein EA397_01745 [Deltaproteobacteria bacterium]|nr:MAG: hypothetical protein EA397_01745 [Deltaproteobacteria bacterium]